MIYKNSDEIQAIKQKINALQGKSKKAREKRRQKRIIMCDENSKSYCSMKSLYEYTRALLELEEIERDILYLEKKILQIERDELWWEKYCSEDSGVVDQQPDEQPLVYLTDNVIPFPGERMVTHV